MNAKKDSNNFRNLTRRRQVADPAFAHGFTISFVGPAVALREGGDAEKKSHIAKSAQESLLFATSRSFCNSSLRLCAFAPLR
jgi:hypothetical protein